MVEDVAAKLWRRTRAYDVATLFVTRRGRGQSELRHKFEQDAANEGLAVYFPSRLASHNDEQPQ